MHYARERRIQTQRLQAFIFYRRFQLNDFETDGNGAQRKRISPIWGSRGFLFQPAMSLCTRSPVLAALYLRIKRAR